MLPPPFPVLRGIVHHLDAYAIRNLLVALPELHSHFIVIKNHSEKPRLETYVPGLGDVLLDTQDFFLRLFGVVGVPTISADEFNPAEHVHRVKLHEVVLYEGGKDVIEKIIKEFEHTMDDVTFVHIRLAALGSKGLELIHMRSRFTVDWDPTLTLKQTRYGEPVASFELSRLTQGDQSTTLHTRSSWERFQYRHLSPFVNPYLRDIRSAELPPRRTMYPNMEKLRSLNITLDRDFSNYHFPELTHLAIHFCSSSILNLSNVFAPLLHVLKVRYTGALPQITALDISDVCTGIYLDAPIPCAIFELINTSAPDTLSMDTDTTTLEKDYTNTSLGFLRNFRVVTFRGTPPFLFHKLDCHDILWSQFTWINTVQYRDFQEEPVTLRSSSWYLHYTFLNSVPFAQPPKITSCGEFDYADTLTVVSSAYLESSAIPLVRNLSLARLTVKCTSLNPDDCIVLDAQFMYRVSMQVCLREIMLDGCFFGDYNHGLLSSSVEEIEEGWSKYKPRSRLLSQAMINSNQRILEIRIPPPREPQEEKCLNVTLFVGLKPLFRRFLITQKREMPGWCYSKIAVDGELYSDALDAETQQLISSGELVFLNM